MRSDHVQYPAVIPFYTNLLGKLQHEPMDWLCWPLCGVSFSLYPVHCVPTLANILALLVVRTVFSHYHHHLRTSGKVIGRYL